MSWNKGLTVRMGFTRLLINRNDGSPVVEYRIENGCVERRILEPVANGSCAIEGQWQRFTPEQLASHLKANTILAHWVSRRFGVHSLIRACSQHSSSVHDERQECRPPTRSAVVGEFSPLLAT